MSGVPSSADDFGALSDVDISDITTDEGAAEMLRRLRDNDPNLYKLWVNDNGVGFGEEDFFFARENTPWDARGMGVLGYYLGRSSEVTDVCISLSEDVNMNRIAPFLSGLGSNKSVQRVNLRRSHLPCEFSQMLTPFIKNNPNLTKFDMKWCEVDAEKFRALSSALREGKSLKEFWIAGLGDGRGFRLSHEESIIENIEALKMHPQLEELYLQGFDMGRNVCAALSDLLQQSHGMRTFSLRNNCIDDSGVEALADGLARCRSLRACYLSENPSITVRGWRALSTVLENPNSRLEGLQVWGNSINDEIAAIFANALARNNSLELLNLHSAVESSGGTWKAFSKVLCDTSSVNNTFLSNHTLQRLRPGRSVPGVGQRDVASLLALNEDDDKRAVAIRKILLYHGDIDMQPLFEWDLKVLPVVVEWMERAAAYEIESEARTEKRKISAIYQFVRGMPELAVEGILGGNEQSAKTGGEKRLHSTAFEG